ncbi:MAG: restriction endonuclease [Candidatus Verstraetearchaeota archaeon]|nr:restriction endonuclease [Candidatus Verstraetearchaeota archaeon]
MSGPFDFLRKIVNPILNNPRYWSLPPEFQDELRRMIFSDEKKYADFKDYGILEKYLKCEFRNYWEYFREKYENYAEMIDQIFVEILRKTADCIEPLKRSIEAIIKDETEEVKYLVTIVDEDEEFRPLSGAKVELWLQDKLLNKFITDEEGVAHIGLKPREKKHIPSIKVVISKDGYEEVMAPLTLLNDRIALKRKRGIIKLRVLENKLKPDGTFEKNPLANCSVSVKRCFSIVKKGMEITKRNVETCALTDENGIVNFKLPFGKYEISVEAKDFEPEVLPLDLNRDLIERDIELKREKYEHLHVIVNRVIVGDRIHYEPIKGCKVLQVKVILGDENAEEFDVPFIQLEDNEGRIIIKSESEFDFNAHCQYKVKVSIPVDNKYEEREGKGKPPTIEVRIKPKVSEEFLSKLLSKLSGKELSEVDPYEFVEIMKRLLMILGYENVKIIDGPRDEGADLICTKGESKVIVQCKRWKNSVGSRVIREFIGAMNVKRADEGIFITTSSLTEDAKDCVEKAKKTGGLKIEIFDNTRLKQLLRNLKSIASEPS